MLLTQRFIPAEYIKSSPIVEDGQYICDNMYALSEDGYMACITLRGSLRSPQANDVYPSSRGDFLK